MSESPVSLVWADHPWSHWQLAHSPTLLGIRHNNHNNNHNNVHLSCAHQPLMALSAHMIHINLNMIFCTHVEHSPTFTSARLWWCGMLSGHHSTSLVCFPVAGQFLLLVSFLLLISFLLLARTVHQTVGFVRYICLKCRYCLMANTEHTEPCARNSQEISMSDAL